MPGREDEGVRLLEPFLETDKAALEAKISVAVNWTLAANIVLLLAKTFAFLVSGSMAILASTADSLVDLVSQALIALTDAAARRPEPYRYPAGKARLESLGVIGCAAIMMLAAVGVVYESSRQLYDGLAHHSRPQLDMTPLLYGILAAAMVSKAVLWWWCYSLRNDSAAVLALAEDNANDAVSNAGAIITAAVAAHSAGLWWSDPAGGILISIYILTSWTIITRNQIGKIVGKAGPAEFIERLSQLAAAHDARCAVGFIRAYHGGQRLLVDIELEAPGHMTTRESTALARTLRQKVEALPEVESASVFVVSATPGDGGLPLLAPGTANGKRPGEGEGQGHGLEAAESGAASITSEASGSTNLSNGGASAGTGLARALTYSRSLRHSPERCLATAPLILPQPSSPLAQ